MTNTSPLRRTVAAAAFALTVLSPLAACGSTAPSGPFPYCYGPETPDDLEDLFDRDTVRVDDSVCAQGAYPRGHGIAYASSWSDLPDVGEELDSDSEWGYHRTHRRSTSPTVVYVVNSSRPTTSVLVVREPTVGSPRVRSTAGSAAASARKEAPPAAAPARSSTVTRGGLGSDKADPANAARLKSQSDAAAKAAEAGRKASAMRSGTSSSSKSSSSSSGSSSKSSSSSKGK